MKKIINIKFMMSLMMMMMMMMVMVMVMVKMKKKTIVIMVLELQAIQNLESQATQCSSHKRNTAPYGPHATARERLRTAANRCGRLRTLAIVNAPSSERTLNPQTFRVKREPLLPIRET